jgi:hypothetical protein
MFHDEYFSCLSIFTTPGMINLLHPGYNDEEDSLSDEPQHRLVIDIVVNYEIVTPRVRYLRYLILSSDCRMGIFKENIDVVLC